ncbi:MAG: hypothetical protein ACYSU7_03930 [Planctomycetota bacterium]|jgi:hypothetical protein
MRILLTLVLVLALAALAGCSRKGTTGESTNTGFFTGYELGNEQDQTNIREERPGYQRYE